ncbi:hypothetical protein NKG05_12970 [Oerskovia sp. M15]
MRESSFTAAELLAAYQSGVRNDATLVENPVNHAASAVAAMVGVLRGEPARQATPAARASSSSPSLRAHRSRRRLRTSWPTGCGGVGRVVLDPRHRP